METTQVKFELNKSKDIFRKYFKSERKREIQKIPFKVLSGLAISLVLTGLFTSISPFWIFGLGLILALGLFLLYFIFRFEMASRNFLKTLEIKAESSEKDFQFSFNSDLIQYKSQNTNSEFKWSALKDYELNGGDIYLFLENRELFDIISESIIGKEKFKMFEKLLILNIPK